MESPSENLTPSVDSSAAETADTEKRIERDRCELWVNGLPRAAISNATTAGLVVLLLREAPGDQSAYAWLYTVIAVNIVRLAYTPWLRRWLLQGDASRATRHLAIWLWISAIVWSAPALVFFPKGDFALQAVLAVGLLSVSAGAVMSHIVTPGMALVVPCLVLIPFTLRCLQEGTSLPLILALLCVLFLTIVFFMERDWGNHIDKNLRLSLHNEHLSDKWKAAHRQAIEAIHGQEQFLRKMSHEIRTPLNGIQGMTKLLLTQGGHGLSKQSLKVIEESSDRLLTLINELFGSLGEKPEVSEEAVKSLFTVDAAETEAHSRGDVLIVEDNPVNQMVLALHLEKRGYRVEAVDGGEKALLLQREREFDVVLMDCQMPGLDGFETTRRWRQCEAATGRRTPIIAVTANAVSGDREACLEAGMDDYVPKPIDPCLLFQKLDRLPKRETVKPAPVEQTQERTMAEYQSLNHKALEALRDFDDGKGEVLAEVVKKFLESTTDLIKPLPSHCATQAWEEVRRITHTVKSSAATVGAVGLSELAKKIEHNIRDKNYATTEADCAQLAVAYAASTAALNQYLATSLQHAA